MKLLVKFKKNWADELDVYGMKIMSREDFDELMEALPRIEYSFGTNEGWERGELKRSDFTVTALTDVGVGFFTVQFHGIESYGWGNFPSLDYAWEDEEDDWIEWTTDLKDAVAGEGSPVEGLVDYKMRSGDVEYTVRADWLYWGNTGDDYDIVAYRKVPNA
jgi:hypothetical protein